MPGSPPAPGQTITGGSWAGPDSQTVQNPQPAVGQNQGLRLRLGLGVPAPPPKPQGFAQGTPFVMPAPAPGQTVSNGSWTPPQTNQTGQNLRAQLGMGVPRPAVVQKPQGFAEGTANAQPQPAPQQYSPGSPNLPMLPSFDPSAPTAQDQAVQAAGANHDAPYYAQSASMAAAGAQNDITPQLAQLQNVGPNGVHRLWDSIFGNQASTAALDQKSQAASVYGRPDAQTYLSQHPELLATAKADPVGFSMKLGPVLDAVAAAHGAGGATPSVVTHNLPDGSVISKPVDNHDQVTAAAAATGAPYHAAHAATETHHYSQDEFVQAMSNVPSAMVDRLMGMQHYLKPQEALIPNYLNALKANEDKALQTYNAATSAAEKAKAKDAYDQARALTMGTVSKLVERQQYALPTLGMGLGSTYGTQ